MGATLALVLGAGGVLTTSAATSSIMSSYVPISSCRLLDTRSGSDNVGVRSTPLSGGETLDTAVWGANGNCIIPESATGVAMNVTVLESTSSSFLTVFPSDVTRPLTSSLNWVAGQPPTPNAVTARLSGTGRVSFYNLAGAVQLVVDIVGYYVPSTAGASGAAGERGESGPVGPPGPTGPTGATGPAGANGRDGVDGATGPAGPTGPKGDPGDPAPVLENVLWVSPSGGDYTTVGAALASIGTTRPASSATVPYVIEVGPGVFTETSSISLKDHVVLRGQGRDVTRITCVCAADGRTIVAPSGVTAEVRDLTVATTGTGYAVSPISAAANAVLTVRHVDIDAAAGGNSSTAISAAYATLNVVDVGATVRSSPLLAYGLDTSYSTVSVDGLRVDLTATAGSTAIALIGMRQLSGSATVSGLTVSMHGGNEQYGMILSTATVSMSDSDLRASGATATNTALNSFGSTFTVRSSTLRGTKALDLATTSGLLFDSVLQGTITGLTAGRCHDVVDTTFAALSC